MRDSRKLCCTMVDTLGRELMIRRPVKIDEDGWPIHGESFNVVAGQAGGGVAWAWLCGLGVVRGVFWVALTGVLGSVDWGWMPIVTVLLNATKVPNIVCRSSPGPLVVLVSLSIGSLGIALLWCAQADSTGRKSGHHAIQHAMQIARHGCDGLTPSCLLTLALCRPSPSPPAWMWRPLRTCCPSPMLASLRWQRRVRQGRDGFISTTAHATYTLAQTKHV